MRADDVAVHDAGRIINPLLAAGQVHGARSRASTTPAFILDTVETLSPLNPLGAKGVGAWPTLD